MAHAQPGTKQPEPTRPNRKLKATASRENALKLLALIFPAVIGGIFVWAGQLLVFSNSSRELDIKMVDVSLSILSGERGRSKQDIDSASAYQEYKLARLFALRTLSKYSGVSISKSEMEEWAAGGRISFGPIPSNLEQWEALKALIERYSDGCPPGFTRREEEPKDCVEIANPDAPADSSSP